MFTGGITDLGFDPGPSLVLGFRHTLPQDVAHGRRVPPLLGFGQAALVLLAAEVQGQRCHGESLCLRGCEAHGNVGSPVVLEGHPTERIAFLR